MAQLIACTSNVLPMVVNILNRHQLAYDEIDSSDSNFPSLDLGANNHLLIVNEAFEQVVLDELSAVPEIRLIEHSDHSPKKGKFKWSPFLLTAYTLVATFAAIYFGYFYMQGISDKNYEYTWDTWGTEQSAHHKKTGALESIAYDENRNLCFEKLVNYGLNRKAVFVNDDVDENGVFEYSRTHCDGKLSEEWIDENQDYFFERAFLYLESGDVLKLVDTNGNGLYELEE